MAPTFFLDTRDDGKSWQRYKIRTAQYPVKIIKTTRLYTIVDPCVVSHIPHEGLVGLYDIVDTQRGWVVARLPKTIARSALNEYIDHIRFVSQAEDVLSAVYQHTQVKFTVNARLRYQVLH